VTPRVRLAIAAAVTLAGGTLFLLELDNPAFSVARLSLVVSVGLLMVAAGLVAAANGEDRVGVIVVLAGAGWLGERLLRAIPNGLTATTSALLTGLWLAFLVHAIVTFPSGRLRSWFERAVVGAGYVFNFGLNVPYLLVGPSLTLIGVRERNVFLVAAHPDAARRIGETTQWLTLGWMAVVVGLIGVEAWTAGPAARRAYGFVWLAGTVLGVSVMVIIGAAEGVLSYRDAYGLWLEIAAGLTPVTLAASLFITRVAQDRLVALVADLETVGPGGTLRSALRRALADPALDVVYLRAGSGGWIDEVGQVMMAPVTVGGRALTPIERGGKPIAALVHDPVLLRNPERLQAAIRAAALAIDNEQLKAELRAQLLDMRASRSRIVEAGDHERRRVERNLHDGAQQRLVGLALTLRLASRRAEGDETVTALLAEAAGELDDALEELRELARGLHPAIVADAGLAGALETLAERSGLPVDLSVDLPERLPEPVEVGAYYLVAEALANANKHARAEQVTVRAAAVEGRLWLAVTDDGRGGAVAAPGSGLEGLNDRVGALGGQLLIESDAGSGTRVIADIPLGVPDAPEADPRRMTALKWMGWELFELPEEIYDQVTDEDNLTWVKAMFACAGGVDRITQHERDWVVGYHTAAGDADWVIEAVRTYDAVEQVQDIMKLPSMTNTARGLLYDTLRMCSSDGALTSDEVDCVLRAADEMGVSRDVVGELHRIVDQEQGLRRQRYELITAPVLPAARGGSGRADILDSPLGR
jgi:signal transduction histidine kinase